MASFLSPFLTTLSFICSPAYTVEPTRSWSLQSVPELYASGNPLAHHRRHFEAVTGRSWVFATVSHSFGGLPADCTPPGPGVLSHEQVQLVCVFIFSGLTFLPVQHLARAANDFKTATRVMQAENRMLQNQVETTDHALQAAIARAEKAEADAGMATAALASLQQQLSKQTMATLSTPSTSGTNTGLSQVRFGNPWSRLLGFSSLILYFQPVLPDLASNSSGSHRLVIDSGPGSSSSAAAAPKSPLTTETTVNLRAQNIMVSGFNKSQAPPAT